MSFSCKDVIVIFPRIFMVLFFIGILMFIICCFSKPAIFQYYITFITICLPAVCALMVPATNKATDDIKYKNILLALKSLN